MTTANYQAKRTEINNNRRLALLSVLEAYWKKLDKCGVSEGDKKNALTCKCQTESISTCAFYNAKSLALDTEYKNAI